jgi:hypothetical protein
MRRSILVTVAVLGTLISFIGSTGLFAALTDTARTGVNTVNSAGLAASADIRLATATYGGDPSTVTCGTFAEDITTGLFTVHDAEPSATALDEKFFCIKNVGSQSVALAALADDLSDVDTACTGDEALYDSTCGGNAAGELSDNLLVSYLTVSCATGSGSGSAATLNANATTPVTLGSLGTGVTGCYLVRIFYADTTTPDNVQKAQSDKATWRFKFTAQA